MQWTPKGAHLLLQTWTKAVDGDLEGIVNLLDSHTVCQSYGMNTPSVTTKYKNLRFPAEIIRHAVWLYFRFCVSFRDVEELLLERGVVVTYEAIRK